MRKKYDRTPEGLIDSMFDTLEDIRDGIIQDPGIAVAVTKQSENILNAMKYADTKKLEVKPTLMIEHKPDASKD